MSNSFLRLVETARRRYEAFAAKLQRAVAEQAVDEDIVLRMIAAIERGAERLPVTLCAVGADIDGIASIAKADTRCETGGDVIGLPPALSGPGNRPSRHCVCRESQSVDMASDIASSAYRRTILPASMVSAQLRLRNLPCRSVRDIRNENDLFRQLEAGQTVCTVSHNILSP